MININQFQYISQDIWFHSGNSIYYNGNKQSYLSLYNSNEIYYEIFGSDETNPNFIWDINPLNTRSISLTEVVTLTLENSQTTFSPYFQPK